MCLQQFPENTNVTFSTDVLGALSSMQLDVHFWRKIAARFTLFFGASCTGDFEIV